MPDDKRYGSFLQPKGLQYVMYLDWRCLKFAYGGMGITTHKVDYDATPRWGRYGLSYYFMQAVLRLNQGCGHVHYDNRVGSSPRHRALRAHHATEGRYLESEQHFPE